ncbi:hypothetical protein JCM5350_003484 [Sporobolomyces pararoseus]
MLIAPVKTGVDYPIDENSSELEVWERHAEGHFDRDAWGVEPLPENSIIKARFDVDVWQDSFDISPLWEIEDRSLASIIHSSQPSEYPFSSLSSVSLGINLKVEVLLIFYTRLFPSLLFLTLVAHDFFGSLDSLDHATFRYSITRRKGSGGVAAKGGEVLRQYEPLSQVEEGDYPLRPYRGPDLSKLRIVDMGR